MKKGKTIGNARFKDGKLVIPSKQKDEKFKRKYNDYKNKYKKDNYYGNSAKYENNIEESDDSKNKLDLEEWKNQNQDDWLKLRKKVEEKRIKK